VKVQFVTPYRVSHLQRYGVTVRGNVTSVYQTVAAIERAAIAELCVASDVQYRWSVRVFACGWERQVIDVDRRVTAWNAFCKVCVMQGRLSEVY
jgi:hypothetical protein